MVEKIVYLIATNSFFKLLIIAVTLDTILGVLRAIKHVEFNSAFGIDGAIRKIAMLISVVALMAMDVIMNVNILFMVPENYIRILGIEKLGVSEFFCLLFCLYESVSILKNLTLCGAPVPAGLQVYITKFLDDITDELDDDSGGDRDERN